jgi:hypothetical protein
MTELDQWLTRKKAVAYLERLGCPISIRTLEKWASNDNAGKGPPFSRSRKRIVRYKLSDLSAWASKEIVRVE